MTDESARTVAVALAADVGVAVAKLVAAIVTGSAAMSAEASHAIADTGNQLLLLVAQRTSHRPPDSRHPFGYGRSAYFWALIASVAVFIAGAVFSLREGILELLHPIVDASFVAVYVVLAVSLALDSVSLFRATHQLRADARLFRRDFLDQVMLTSDPILRAVFAEDAAAVAGDLIALVGVALHHITGSSIPEGVAAVLIGLLLVGVGVELARRNRDFLLGEQAPPAVRAEVQAFLDAQPGLVSVRELLVTFVGPRQLWVLARVDIDDGLRGDQVEDLVRQAELGLREQSRYIGRVDVVPIGAATAPG